MFSAASPLPSSSKHQPSFLVSFLCPLSWLCSSSSHPTRGEQPIGNVRARIAAPADFSPHWPSPSVFCGAEHGAGLHVEAQWCPCPQCRGASGRLSISSLVTEQHPGPSTRALCLPGADTRTARAADAGPILADTLRKFLFDLDVDDGLAALGYSKADIPALVKGTLPQVRDAAHPRFLLEAQNSGGDMLT